MMNEGADERRAESMILVVGRSWYDDVVGTYYLVDPKIENSLRILSISALLR